MLFHTVEKFLPFVIPVSEKRIGPAVATAVSLAYILKLTTQAFTILEETSSGMCRLIDFVLRSSYIFAKVCGRSCAKFMGIGIKDDSDPALTLQQVVCLLFGGCLHLFYVCAHFGHIRPLISTNTD